MKTIQLYRSSILRATLALAVLVAMIAAVPQVSAQSDFVQVKLRTRLHGKVFNGEKPFGKAEFESENGNKKFSAEADNVALADGSILNVVVDGHKVGTITLVAQGGTLLLTGNKAPNVQVGTRVTIKIPGGQRILTGVF